MTLVGIDTHFPYGFEGKYTIKDYDSTLANSYRTESKLLYEFVKWVQEQDWYPNTTIVIMGDHLSMQSSFFSFAKEDERFAYNVYINSSVKPTSNNRVYTALDTYPSIVASLGGNIKGNKLGLGVNIFSKEKTLVEKYGINKLDKELRKKSSFYYEKFDI